VTSLEKHNEKHNKTTSLGGLVQLVKGTEALADGTEGGVSQSTLRGLVTAAAGLKATAVAAGEDSRFAVVFFDENAEPTAEFKSVFPGFADCLASLLAGGARQLELRLQHGDTLSVEVCAKKDFKAWEPLDVDGGLVWEKRDWNRKVGGDMSSTHLSGFDLLEPALLHKWGYNGQPLVSECTSRASYSFYIDDPSFHSDMDGNDMEANVGAFFVLDLRVPDKPVPGIVYQALKPIAKGDQLLMDWGTKTWMSLSELYLSGQATNSIWHRRYLALLRARCTARLVQPGLISEAELEERLLKVKPVKGDFFTFVPDVEGKYGIADYIVDSEAAPSGGPDTRYASRLSAECDARAPWKASEAFVDVPDDQLAAVFGAVEHSETTDVSDLDGAMRARLAALSLNFKQPSADELRLLKGEVTVEEMGVRVARVVDNRHPARFYSTPEQEAYALVARRTLKPGTAVCLYAGKLRTDSDFDQTFGYPEVSLQYYAYDIPSVWSDCDTSKLNGGRGFPLVLESRDKGGVGRFVNDCWSRPGGTECVNVVPEAMWDPVLRVPTLIIRTTKVVKEGEELVSDYGEAFWRFVWRDLRKSHTQYWRKVSPRCDSLEKLLTQHGIPLPRKPAPTPPRRYMEASERPDDGEADDEAGPDE